MITYKVKHGCDLTSELQKAKLVADFALNNKFKTNSSLVKHIGLKSTISNQILRKYGKNKTIKKISNVNLIVPSNNKKDIKITDKNLIYIPCLKITLNPWFDITQLSKINQIELDETYAYITVILKSNKPTHQYHVRKSDFIGVDLNAGTDPVVVANPNTGEVKKFGDKIPHIKKFYKNKRAKLQKQKKYREIRKIKNRESRRIRDELHKISRAIVDYAKELDIGIKLEDLTGIRKKSTKTSGKSKTLNSIINNWNFSQLRSYITYKAKMCDLEVRAINPFMTSQTCSVCKSIGIRNKKSFVCGSCGHVDHSDANAAFNIACV